MKREMSYQGWITLVMFIIANIGIYILSTFKEDYFLYDFNIILILVAYCLGVGALVASAFCYVGRQLVTYTAVAGLLSAAVVAAYSDQIFVNILTAILSAFSYWQGYKITRSLLPRSRSSRQLPFDQWVSVGYVVFTSLYLLRLSFAWDQIVIDYQEHEVKILAVTIAIFASITGLSYILGRYIKMPVIKFAGPFLAILVVVSLLIGYLGFQFAYEWRAAWLLWGLDFSPDHLQYWGAFLQFVITGFIGGSISLRQVMVAKKKEMEG